MDEFDQGMDPEVKLYFRKIVASITLGVLWLLFFVALGLFLDLFGMKHGIYWPQQVFYFLGLVSLIWLLSYYYRTWIRKS